jgi:hypothetical protein
MRLIRNIVFFCIGLLLGAISVLAFAGEIPDPALTPGITRDVTLNELCTTSTKLVRNVPESEKIAVYEEYGMSGNVRDVCKAGAEVDHLISLELGGSNDIKNLWPESFCGSCNAHMKDRLENVLHALVCKGLMTLPDAQYAITHDWRIAYQQYVDTKGCAQ